VVSIGLIVCGIVGSFCLVDGCSCLLETSSIELVSLFISGEWVCKRLAGLSTSCSRGIAVLLVNGYFCLKTAARFSARACLCLIVKRVACLTDLDLKLELLPHRLKSNSFLFLWGNMALRR
jgi:hypothetical protein